ncbi:hypothetical protein FEZ60_29655 [Rhodococcus sp. MS16]|nr:hypothetical protein [Rhodococcus sp. MS16]
MDVRLPNRGKSQRSGFPRRSPVSRNLVTRERWNHSRCAHQRNHQRKAHTMDLSYLTDLFGAFTDLFSALDFFSGSLG